MPSSPLSAISAVDGRYRSISEALAPYFSEYAFIRYRMVVECEYLIALSKVEGIGMRALTKEEERMLRALAEACSLEDGARVKEIEATTNHDVKAVEYFIKERLKTSSLADVGEWAHFALTSEDVNNIAYALMLSDALSEVIAPDIEEIIGVLDALSNTYADSPMLSRTHGQSASPTTFGKEMRVFHARLARRIAGLESIRILAKLNGASGNWNAHAAAYPSIDWMKFSETFIESFNDGRRFRLLPNLETTQIESHDSYVAVFDTLRRMNTILIDFSQDMWRYISDGWITGVPKEGEVGSSTMPHKVNPIDFENAEGNYGVANALFEHYARKLPISRLQRDLSDSTVERTFGTAFAHTHLAHWSLLKGLGKIRVNEEAMREALVSHPEVIAEAIQTILRREGADMPYEKLKELTRGKAVTLPELRAFIGGLSVSDGVKEELLALSPETYLGLAGQIARNR